MNIGQASASLDELPEYFRFIDKEDTGQGFLQVSGKLFFILRKMQVAIDIEKYVLTAYFFAISLLGHFKSEIRNAVVFGISIGIIIKKAGICRISRDYSNIKENIGSFLSCLNKEFYLQSKENYFLYCQYQEHR